MKEQHGESRTISSDRMGRGIIARTHPHLRTLDLPLVPIPLPAPPFALQVMQHARQVHRRVLRSTLARPVTGVRVLVRIDWDRVPILIDCLELLLRLLLLLLLLGDGLALLLSTLLILHLLHLLLLLLVLLLLMHLLLSIITVLHVRLLRTRTVLIYTTRGLMMLSSPDGALHYLLYLVS
jgi:hypothetical protein